MINRCALGIILNRGQKVFEPTLSELSQEEQDYLGRHVDTLRDRHQDENTVRVQFASGSGTDTYLREAQDCSDEMFVGIAVTMTKSLAEAMARTGNAKDCVVALVTGDVTEGGQHTTFLKLDAKIEAARLQQLQPGKISLKVFKDLLPAPGDMQKGFSWPDPRSPQSELVLFDANRTEVALYFGQAFRLRISRRAIEAEKALVDEIVSQLPPADVSRAAALADEGGQAEVVVERIRGEFPQFESRRQELGAAGALAGPIRPRQVAQRKAEYYADGIVLKVPLILAENVVTRREGDGYVTTIRTRTPLTDPIDD